MRKFWARLKVLFWPGADKPVFTRLLPYIILVLLGLAIGGGGLGIWEYTNSSKFCGTTCHTMPPQYTTYLNSSHSRVDCVECHLGRDVFAVQLPRKIAHAKFVYDMVFNTYKYPIVATDMIPASTACETCHYPQQFTNDTLKEVKYHLSDAGNTPQSIFLTLKIGGGTARQGLGQGIHWHIENKVTYYSPDTERQNIPYVRVEDANGKVTEYFDVSTNINPDTIKGKKLYTVDCNDCHNRVSHTIPSPAQMVDAAMYSGTISDKVPYMRQKAVALLSATYPDFQSGLNMMNSLANDYHDNLPDVYGAYYPEIVQAIYQLRTIYQQTNFPDQLLDWQTHPDNVGHMDSAGCFRCHDGKHISADGAKAIRLECNLCHNIPVVADASQFVTNIPIIRGPEPATHTNSSWIALHGKVIDATCAGCHPPTDPKVDYTKLNGQKPPADGSFCGNVTCHGTLWKYIGLDALALQPYLQKQLAAMPTAAPTRPPAAVASPTPAAGGQPAATPTYQGVMKAIFDSRCSTCHTGSTAMANMNLSTYASILQGNKDGPGVAPGNLDGSLIYKIQSAGGHFGQMSAAELSSLKAWILGGALEK